MSLIVCCSITGAPGVTTTALGLSLTWPRNVLLLDADRDPAQTIPAGYLRGVDLGGRGIGALLQAHRERRGVLDELLSQSVALQEHPTWSRRFVPGFSQPGTPLVFDPVWPGLADACANIARTDTDVLVDAGRIGRSGLPTPWLVEADVVLVVLRSNLRALAAARLHMPVLQETIAATGGALELGIALVGPGMPYTASDISAQFGVPVLATIDWEPKTAAVLSDGDAEPRRFAESRLIRSYRSAASRLHSHSFQRAQLIDSGTADQWQDWSDEAVAQ